MKKITLNVLLSIAMLVSFAGNSQNRNVIKGSESSTSTQNYQYVQGTGGCLTAGNGLYPAGTYTATTCDGITVNNVTTLGYAGEFSNVNVNAGETYNFSSSIATDWITISTDDGLSVAAFGPTPLTWVAVAAGVVRFYTHADNLCAENTTFRTRSFVCGIPACTMPTVTFAKMSNCPTATFNVTANISNLGSATSITVTDNQASAPQTISAPGTVTFGPYANGTSATLTVTNDQSATCTMTSAAQTQVACPPANDNFANAIGVICGETVTGNTTAATLDEDNAPDGFGADMDAPNVWYTYTGSGAPETITFNLCASSYDTSVLVYTGTAGSLTIVGGNDDDASCGTGLTLRSRGNFASDGTSTYYIAIEGYNVGSVGAYSMDLTCAAVTPPAVLNQTCTTSLPVSVNGVDENSDNSYGDVSATQPTCDPFGAVQDVWFSFVATSPTVDVLVTPGTMSSTNFAIYSGDCAALVLIPGTCDANLTAPTTENLTTLTMGSTYYVQVWSSFAEQGTFALRLTDPSLAVSNFDSSNFTAYPNPVKGNLNLSYDKEISKVSVFNLLGQEVITKAVNANLSQIDMSHLTTGTYMVKVTADNQVKTIKVVKE